MYDPSKQVAGIMKQIRDSFDGPAAVQQTHPLEFFEVTYILGGFVGRLHAEHDITREDVAAFGTWLLSHESTTANAREIITAIWLVG
jgi:hypothetical protein